jgi:hypothetical protein
VLAEPAHAREVVEVEDVLPGRAWYGLKAAPPSPLSSSQPAILSSFCPQSMFALVRRRKASRLGQTAAFVKARWLPR